MALVLKVKWVDQSDSPELHQRIKLIGGNSGRLQWKHTQAEAVESIERGLFAYYVERNALVVKLDIAQAAGGQKYLISQNGPAGALLDLPGFPKSTRPAVADG